MPDFSAEELEGWRATRSDPVKVIDFLLVGHVENPITLETLLDAGVFVNRPPQLIAALSEDRYQSLKPLTRLGFDF